MKQHIKQFFQKHLPNGVRYILSWLWVKQFLYWAILSAGTIAECAFLIASIWMSINSSVHPMVLTVMTEKQSVQLSYIATTIYTALPELILSLALVTTINHCRNIRWERQYWYTWVWATLFGLPTVVFLSISIMTVSCSVLKVNYVMPDWGIVSRALAGFSFAIVYLLYEQIGKPCYASERQSLEQTIADQEAKLTQTIAQFEDALKTANENSQKSLAESNEEKNRIQSHFETALRTANSNFQIAMQSKQSEFDYRINEILEQGKDKIEHLQMLLETQNAQVQKLSEKASSLERHGIENYPKVISELVEKQVKTVSVDEASALTGHSKRRINAAKSLQRHSRNKDLIIVSSLIEWLKTVPLPETQMSSNGHLIDDENDTDPLGLPVLTITALED